MCWREFKRGKGTLFFYSSKTAAFDTVAPSAHLNINLAYIRDQGVGEIAKDREEGLSQNMGILFANFVKWFPEENTKAHSFAVCDRREAAALNSMQRTIKLTL